MKNLLLFILFLPATILAQDIQILSQKDKKAVPFANIVYLANDSIIGGTYSNEEGKARLQLAERVNFIAVSSIGYQTLKIAKKDINSQIYLVENIAELAEITLNPQKLTTKYLGNPIKNTHHFWHFNSGSEKILFIENTFKEEKIIKSFSFFLKKFDNVLPVFKVVFYTCVNGYPAKIYNENTTNNVFVLDKNEKNKVKLDIEKMNIILPKEGVFVGLEYVGIVDKDTKNIMADNHFYTAAMEKKPSGISIAVATKKSETKPLFYTKLKFLERMKGWIDCNQPPYKNPNLAPNEYYVPTFGIEVYE
ncbi:MAG: hypothetical protein EAZ95_01055 [Bacteroidetes bacterium]|nr:MAG: hypothetical protein EAZ95_01055 [Bacteroidota bacterium]